MTNHFFSDEEITRNDLYFICYMIERVARKLHQRNKYVVNAIDKKEWTRLISLANVLHCENPLKIKDQWIDEYSLESGSFDITEVYNDPISEVIDNYNSSAFYEPSYVIARAYNEGGF